MATNDDIKELLEQNLRVTKENNHLLRALRRAAMYRFLGRILFWAIVLGIPAYLYVSFVSPLFFGNATQRNEAWQNLLNTSNISTQTVQNIITKVSTYSSVIKK